MCIENQPPISQKVIRFISGVKTHILVMTKMKPQRDEQKSSYFNEKQKRNLEILAASRGTGWIQCINSGVSQRSFLCTFLCKKQETSFY